MIFLLLVVPLFGLINAQHTNFYDNLERHKQDFYKNTCIQHPKTPRCQQIYKKAETAIDNNCSKFYVKMEYNDKEDCINSLINVFKKNLKIQKPIQKPKETIKPPQHNIPRAQPDDDIGVTNYDDYNAVLNVESDKKQKEIKSYESLSSEEGDYDEDFWKKKDSRETLLKDINSVEKEVGVEKTLDSFKMPKINHAPKEQYGRIAADLIKKHKWLKTINPRVSVSNGELHFYGPKFFKNPSVLLKLRPKPNGPGHVIFSSGNELHVNFLQGKTSCGVVGTSTKRFICIKPLDIHIRVRAETSYGKYDWDLVCMQLYLPSWKYGYEFCYNADRSENIQVKDRHEDRYFRKMKLFVFNGGTYDNWEPEFINM